MEDFKIGDTLVSEQIVPCGECEYCKQGIYWMCTRSAVFGFKQYAQGGFAEYIKLSKNCINHKVPESFTPEQAVMIEPIACGMHAVERAQIQHSDVVVIAGLGCDVYFEVSGSPKSVTQGLDSLRNLGRYVQMGVFAEEVKADWNTIGDGKELTIIGSHLSGLTYDSVITGIASGLIKTEGLISHSYKLEDWEEAFKKTEAPDAMKVMLVP